MKKIIALKVLIIISVTLFASCKIAVKAPVSSDASEVDQEETSVEAILGEADAGNSAEQSNGAVETSESETAESSVTEPPAATESGNSGSGTTTVPAKTYSFTGTWQLSDSWGKMYLTQTGDKVTGTYETKGGIIDGTVSGSVFTGTWYQTTNQSTGSLQLAMSDDGRSFGLKWEYVTDPAKVDWENDVESERSILISSDPPDNDQAEQQRQS